MEEPPLASPAPIHLGGGGVVFPGWFLLPSLPLLNTSEQNEKVQAFLDCMYELWSVTRQSITRHLISFCFEHIVTLRMFLVWSGKRLNSPRISLISALRSLAYLEGDDGTNRVLSCSSLNAICFKLSPCKEKTEKVIAFSPPYTHTLSLELAFAACQGNNTGSNLYLGLWPCCWTLC